MGPLFERNSFKENSVKANYIGWIPNTAGHVYFRHATIRKPRGLDCYEARPPYIKKGDDQVRYILATSLDDLNDNKPKSSDARYTRYIVKAESKNKGELCGDLWMIWNSCNNPFESNFERTIVTLYDELDRQSDNLCQLWVNTGESIDKEALDPQDEVDSLIYKELEGFQSTKDKIYKLLNDISVINGKYKYGGDSSEYWVSHFKFTVSNNGFCYLEPDDPTNPNAEVEVENAYYYLKYLLHMHQHHDAALDALCRVHKISKEKFFEFYIDKRKQLSIDLLRDIKATLINMKLHEPQDDSSTRNARGIAAYGVSLIQQLKAEGILKLKNPEHMDFIKRETIYIESLIKSKNTLQDDAKERSVEKLFYRVNLFFIFLTLFFAPILLLGVEITKLDYADFSKVEAISCNGSTCIDFKEWLACNMHIGTIVVVYLAFLFFAFIVAYYSLYIRGGSFFRYDSIVLLPFERIYTSLTAYPLKVTLTLSENDSKLKRLKRKARASLSTYWPKPSQINKNLWDRVVISIFVIFFVISLIAALVTILLLGAYVLETPIEEWAIEDFTNFSKKIFSTLECFIA